tara:strand:+ start:2078 stop:2986 length:909 start_codon:yes stop_codon:yes gene_type:complete
VKMAKAKKKSVKKKIMKKAKKVIAKKVRAKKSSPKKINTNNFPTIDLRSDSEIAMDFATKIYKKFNKIVKSIILFGSTAKNESVSGSDIDIIIIIDDVSIKWDQELIVWYREELEELIKTNPYKKDLHINTIKLSTWWEDLMKGDPVVLNVIRDGRSLIDFGGFFEPLKYLLVTGKIKSTPEAIYNLLQRAPMHISRSKASELGIIEGLFWSMVDSSQAALIAAGVTPPSPEHIPMNLKQTFVGNGKLKTKYVVWYRDLLVLHKEIVHGKITELKGVEIDEWQDRSEDFLRTMAKLVNDIVR